MRGPKVNRDPPLGTASAQTPAGRADVVAHKGPEAGGGVGSDGVGVSKSNFLVYGMPTTGKTVWVKTARNRREFFQFVVDSDDVFQSYRRDFWDQWRNLRRGHVSDEVLRTYDAIAADVGKMMESYPLSQYPRITNLYVTSPDFIFLRRPSALIVEWEKREGKASPSVRRMLERWSNDALARWGQGPNVRILPVGVYISHVLAPDYGISK